MKIVFNHCEGFGKVAHQDFIHAPCFAVDVSESHANMYEQGWIYWSQRWYNVRSTRIRCSKFRPSNSGRKYLVKHGYSLTIKPVAEMAAEFDAACKEYVERKGYERSISVDEILSHCDSIIALKIGNGISLYSAVSTQDAFVTYAFAGPAIDEVSLGAIAQYGEITCAMRRGFEFVYLLSGYELCCSYKANFHGFEWWTGREWSSDTAMYKQLCERDERILLDGSLRTS